MVDRGMNDLQRRGTLRLFFISDEKSGGPAAGVVVHLSVELAPRAEKQIVSTLRTGADGYVSFKFDAAIAASGRLFVTCSDSHREVLVLEGKDVLAGKDTYTIAVTAGDVSADSPRSGLPAVMEPDVRDSIVSPGSIGLIPQLLPNVGLCSQLTPTGVAVRRYGAFQVLADLCQIEVACKDRPLEFVRGQVLEYEISWLPLGTCLGELLNSFSLAPCEQISIAVADWMRRETAKMDETTDVQQRSQAETDHQSLIMASMQTSSQSEISAWSVGGSLGAKVAIPSKRFPLQLSASIAGGYSNASTSAQAAGSTMQKLSDHISQVASFVATQRSSMVFQTAAAEHQIYQTRTFRNSNHCHFLNVMYYQLDRRYRVETRCKGRRDVILVKYDNTDFTMERAFCNADVLKSVLLDSSLLSCFDDLGPALFCQKPPAPKSLLMDSVTISLHRENGFGDFNVVLSFVGGGSMIVGVFGVPPGSGSVVQTFTLPVAIDPNSVASIALVNLSAVTVGLVVLPPVVATGIDISFHAVGHDDPGKLFSSTTPAMLINWSTYVRPEAPPADPASTSPEESCCVKRLLGHLNCHKRYYNSILWFGEDPNERVMRWRCCEDGGAATSLLTLVANEPMTVHGDFLVFPVANSPLIPVDLEFPPPPQLITLPTPGVYAEGILGQCNTCEEIDDRRYWNWKDSPCCNDTPAPLPPPALQPGVKPSDLKDLKADAITSLVSFTTVPPASDSLLKDLISTLVAKADAGSEEAKSMLEDLLETLKKSIGSPVPAASTPH